MKEKVYKSVLAGLLIGLAGTAYLLSTNKILGSFLFSVGLIAVIYLQTNLYTGKIGYSKLTDIKDLLIMLIGNCGGAAIAGALAWVRAHDTSLAAITTKVSTPLPITLVNAIFCGICVYLAVELFKRSSNIITIIIPVWIFVLCGFNHCIADFFFMTAGGLYHLPHFLTCVVGNSIGALLVNKLTI